MREPDAPEFPDDPEAEELAQIRDEARALAQRIDVWLSCRARQREAQAEQVAARERAARSEFIREEVARRGRTDR